MDEEEKASGRAELIKQLLVSSLLFFATYLTSKEDYKTLDCIEIFRKIIWRSRLKPRTLEYCTNGLHWDFSPLPKCECSFEAPIATLTTLPVHAVVPPQAEKLGAERAELLHILADHKVRTVTLSVLILIYSTCCCTRRMLFSIIGTQSHKMSYILSCMDMSTS
jgi:hypothetical protein